MSEVTRLAMKLRIAGVSAITADLPVFQRHAPGALRACAVTRVSMIGRSSAMRCRRASGSRPR